MRRFRIPMLSCFVVLALAGALAACTNSGNGPDSEQGMMGGRGPDYQH
jgi:predicted small secreted protein